jgi:hypothetical protein
MAYISCYYRTSANPAKEMKYIIIFVILNITVSVFGQKKFDIFNFKTEDYILKKKESLLPPAFFQSDIFYNKYATKQEFAYYKGKDNVKSISITVTNYQTPYGASLIFNKIELLKKEEKSIFAKDWHVIIIKRNQIILFRGGCVFSEKNWNKLQQDFLNEIFYKKNIDNKINYKCGDDF